MFISKSIDLIIEHHHRRDSFDLTSKPSIDFHCYCQGIFNPLNRTGYNAEILTQFLVFLLEALW